jgi:hypothetical protein
MGVLIIDKDRVYDPCSRSDRLLLGHERHHELDGAVNFPPAFCRRLKLGENSRADETQRI